MLDKRVNAGETAVLECMAAGSPKPTLEWTRNGAPFTPTERHFFTADDQLLIIVKAEHTDAGTYTCAMTNSLGSVKQSLELIVDEPRSFTFFQLDWFPSQWTTGLVVAAAVVSVVVITSVIWVCIIYKTSRRPHDNYYRAATTIDETTLDEKEIARLEHEMMTVI